MNKLENTQGNEFEIKDLLTIINDFKWLIIFTSFSFLILTSIYLYFKPSIYSSYSIIEVKTRDKSMKVSDDLLQNAFYSTNKAIEKEMEILRTYEVNKEVIKKLNFVTQIFIQKNYKKHELYGDEIPIKVNKVKVIDSRILNKEIKIDLKKDGYSMEIVNSKKDIFLNKIINDVDLLELDKSKIYPYSKTIKTDYFRLSLEKIEKKNQTIYFKINGDIRNIYEFIIKNRLKVSQLNEVAPLIKISYEDIIPDRAVNYVNNLVNIFLEAGEINKHKRSDKILTFLKKQLNNTKEKLLRSEKELERYKVKNNIINPSVQSSIMIKKMSDIEISISENILKKMLLDDILEIIKNGLNFNAIDSYLTRLEDDRILLKLNSLQDLELEEISLSSEFTDEYPKLIDIRNQILAIKRNIVLNIKSLRSSTLYRIANLKKSKKEYEKNLLNLPKKEITLTNLIRKHKVNSQMYAYLLKKKSEKEMIKVATSSDYKIIEKGYLPRRPIKPKRSLIMLLSLIFGFLVGVFLSIVLNKSSKKIRSIEDIEYSTQLPIYGVIPFFKKQKGHRIEIFDQPQSNFSESYRKLRTDLRFLSESDLSKVILVTSMVAKEGKSSVIANLSAIFQLAGYKTIVIDLDLRKPMLHKYFDIGYNGGMGGYLSGKENMSDIIFSTAYPNLDIIPAGVIPKNPSELILSNRIEVLLEKLKERYDYILINSAPIGTLTDTLNLMKYMDINLVVIRANKAKKPYMERLKKLIGKYNLKNMGLILNGISPKYLNDIGNEV